MQPMEQNSKNLDHLAAQLAQRLKADPNHPAAQRMRADLARLARARKLVGAQPFNPAPDQKDVEK